MATRLRLQGRLETTNAPATPASWYSKPSNVFWPWFQPMCFSPIVSRKMFVHYSGYLEIPTSKIPENKQEGSVSNVACMLFARRQLPGRAKQCAMPCSPPLSRLFFLLSMTIGKHLLGCLLPLCCSLTQQRLAESLSAPYYLGRCQ